METLRKSSKEIHLKSRPKGRPSEENFSLVEVDIPKLQAGNLLVRNHFMSVDPYMRSRMNDRKSYIPPFEIGKVLEGSAIGEVVESQNDDFKVGEFINSFCGWREYFVSNGKGLQKIDPKLAPLPSYLGVLGMTGLTAWVGLNKIAEIKSGETIFISAAAGAVGSVAGQLAALKGCKVIGSAGSDDKIQILLKELQFHSALNYKKEDVLEKLMKLAPEGIDVYFDNVGGDHLQAALTTLKPQGRIISCGAISLYNEEKPLPGPNNLFNIVVKSLTMKGFIVSDYDQCIPEFISEMAPHLAKGRLINKEYFKEGIAEAPNAFLAMLAGENIGKTIVKL